MQSSQSTNQNSCSTNQAQVRKHRIQWYKRYEDSFLWLSNHQGFAKQKCASSKLLVLIVFVVIIWVSGSVSLNPMEMPTGDRDWRLRAFIESLPPLQLLLERNIHAPEHERISQCHLKRDPFERKLHLAIINFQRNMLVFSGSYQFLHIWVFPKIRVPQNGWWK